MFDKLVLWKAVKEPLRLLVLAIIPFLLVYFQGLPYEWAGVILVALRLADSYLHELGKASENEKLVKGITRF